MAINGKFGSRHELAAKNFNSSSTTPKLSYRKGVLVCSTSSADCTSTGKESVVVSNSSSSNNGSSSLSLVRPLPLLQKTQSSSAILPSNITKTNSPLADSNSTTVTSSSSQFPQSRLINSSSCTCRTNSISAVSPHSGSSPKDKDFSTNSTQSQNKRGDKNSGSPGQQHQPGKHSHGSSNNNSNSPRKDKIKFPPADVVDSPICTRKISHGSVGKSANCSENTNTQTAVANNSQQIPTRQSSRQRKVVTFATCTAEDTSKNPVPAHQSGDNTNKDNLASVHSSSCTNPESSSMACVNQNRSQQILHNRHHSHSNLYQSPMGHNHNHHNNYHDYDHSHITNLTQSLQNSSINNHNHQNSNNGFLYNQQHNNSSMSQNQNNRDSRQNQQQQAKQEFIPSFVLVDASKSSNERKIREIVRKLQGLDSAEVEPVANFQDNTGRTALSYACGGGNILVIEELSKLRRLDPNLADNEGMTPLHYASQAGHSEALDLMLSRFEGVVDTNCRNATGLTPLMKAALQGRTRCAKSLLAAGASSHLRDYSRNLTAAEWATFCGRHICAEIINRSAKDNYKASINNSPTSNFSYQSRNSIPDGQQTGIELKRMNSDDSPYYHLYARNTISGATWLKNKIKKALGANAVQGQYGGHSHHSNGNAVRSLADRRPTVSDSTYGLMSNLSGATICAGSLLLPSIKPLIEQQRSQPRLVARKMTIPTLQVTPVKR